MTRTGRRSSAMLNWHRHQLHGAQPLASWRLHDDALPELAQLALLGKVGLQVGHDNSEAGGNVMYYMTKPVASPTGFESGGAGRIVPVLHAICPTVEGVNGADSDSSRSDATGAGRFEPKPALNLHGVVEPALAKALVLAAEAQRWDVVEQLARELQERRVEGARALSTLTTERVDGGRRRVRQ